jgi:hypothetical protein
MCCECHVAPTIPFCFGLLAPTIILSGMFRYTELSKPNQNGRFFSNLDKASTCQKERRKAKRETFNVASLVVLAERGELWCVAMANLR